jgi:hypothetical protein
VRDGHAVSVWEYLQGLDIEPQQARDEREPGCEWLPSVSRNPAIQIPGFAAVVGPEDAIAARQVQAAGLPNTKSAARDLLLQFQFQALLRHGFLIIQRP